MMSRALFNEFKIVSGKNVAIHDIEGNANTDVLHITREHARLLSLGYLRLHFNQYCKNILYQDIASILCQCVAMSIEFTATYYSKECITYHGCSVIVFQTELSYDSDFVKHLVNGKPVTLQKLRAKLAANDCVDYNYGETDYAVEYGLIELPKYIYNNQNGNQFQFSKQIENGLASGDPVDLQDLKNGLNSFDDSFFDSLNTHYLYMGCTETREYWATFGENSNWLFVTLYENGYKYVDEYCLKINDFIDMCFCKDKKTNDLYVYFLKNGQTRIQSKQKTHSDSNNQDDDKHCRNGLFKLDLKNNYYYIGLGSLVCDCKNAGGTSFKMQILGDD